MTRPFHRRLARWLAAGPRRLVPRPLRLWLLHHSRWPRVGRVDFGHLRSPEPLSRVWGGDRGQPVDRWYIERFLERHRDDIRGRMLEIGDDRYTRRFGDGAVTSAEVLHADADHPRADWVADLCHAPQLPSGVFDGVICTQTLHYLADPAASLATLRRILAPGGVLLLTAPTLSRRADEDGFLDRWRFTTAGLRQLLERSFEPGAILVEAQGNTLSAIAFLHGLAREELSEDELGVRDELVEVLVCARAVAPRLATGESTADEVDGP